MAAKVLRIILSSAVLTTQFGIASAFSAETESATSVAWERVETTSSGKVDSTASALTAYDRHRSSESREFLVGSDGVATAAPIARGVTDSEHIKISYSASGSLNEFSGKVNDSLSRQTRSTSPGGAWASSVQECGTSPLPPEKIKLLVEQAAHRYQVDPLFATAITWAESQFDRSRNSDKGARGPMQLMPETARRFGVLDVCDPESNIEGGVKYLRVLLDEFKNPLLVAAAYNAGEGRVYEYGGIPPFKETVGYVARVVNYQISMAMPLRKKTPIGIDRRFPTVMAHKTESGIIAVQKTRTFVGGVMHF